MSKTSILRSIGLACSLCVAGAPYPSSLPRIANPELDTALSRTWLGVKKRNIAPWSDGLVHRPKSEAPGDAVSEASAYGMILALYENDQAMFNSIWDATEANLWNKTSGYYDWRWNNGSVTIDGSGMATDADQDICLMLLFADSLVKKGVWSPHTSRPHDVDYKGRAKVLLSTLWSKAVSGNFNLAPGAGWGGDAFVNPGYFSPASYRIFAQADSAHDWMAVVNQCYKAIQLNPGYAKGLLPDWMKPDGSWVSGSLGYNPFDQGHSLYKDAIRVYWRLALDWTWFREPRAKAFLDSAMKFAEGDPARANFYRIDGSSIPLDSTFALCGGACATRPRQEHSHLTVGMWACAAMASSTPGLAEAWSTELLSHRDGSESEYWGHAVDPSATDDVHAEDTAHNEMYFDQFLAWFGASVLSGRFSNLWEDLADPLPGTPQSWVVQPNVSGQELDFATARLLAKARLAKRANWTLTITHRTTGQTWSTSGSSDTISADWGGLATNGSLFAQGACDAVFSARGLDPVSIPLWVAHQKDLRTPDGKWIVVDDFPSSTLSPNLGSWSSFDNSSKGGTARISNLAVGAAGPNHGLGFSYDVGQNGYQFCGLSWNSEGWAGLAGVQKVSFRAKADHAPLYLDFYLVQSDITDDNYFHVIDTVGTAWKTFTLSLADMTGRLGSRSGSADPSKGSAFRWHIQYDKQPSGAPVAGSVTIDSFHLAGNMSVMYSAPAAYLPMPPEVSLHDRQGSVEWSVRACREGLRVRAKTPATLELRTLDGRVLLSTAVGAGETTLKLPSHGAGIAVLQSTGSRSVFPVAPGR